MAEPRNIQIYVRDMLESAEKIIQYVDGIDKDQFEAQEEKQDAVIRRLEIMGEAAKQVPPQIRDQFPYIPWRQMAGMRDVMIHAYFGVSIPAVWKVTQEDLPVLIPQLQAVLQFLEQNPS